MKALKQTTVEALISYAEAGELDNLTGEMVRLSPDALAELKALMWLGKDQDSPKHWDALDRTLPRDHTGPRRHPASRDGPDGSIRSHLRRA